MCAPSGTRSGLGWTPSPSRTDRAAAGLIAVPRRWLHTAGAEGNNHINWRFPMFILAQIAHRRITRPPVVAAVKVDDLTALAVAVGVLTSPTVRPAR